MKASHPVNDLMPFYEYNSSEIKHGEVITSHSFSLV